MKAIAMASLILGVAGGGLYVWKHDGVPSRLPGLAVFTTDLWPQTFAAWTKASCPAKAGPRPFENCNERIDPSKKTILIWGDSYAGHLMPGFHEQFDANYNVVGRAQGACAPIVDTLYEQFAIQSGLNTKNCVETNVEVFDWVRRVKPDRVVLAASWGSYAWGMTEKTVQALRGLGISDIEVVGQPVVWEVNLQHALYEAYRKSLPHAVPRRLPVGPNGASLGPFEIDQQMRRWAEGLNLTYISLTDRLCNTEGCLALAGSDDHLMSVDTAHFTVWGSDYVVSTFPR
jgi:SGNH domain (fused to AT3 domains)